MVSVQGGTCKDSRGGSEFRVIKACLIKVEERVETGGIEMGKEPSEALVMEIAPESQ